MKAIAYCVHSTGTFRIVTVLARDGSLSHEKDSPDLVHSLADQGAEKISSHELHTRRQQLLAKIKDDAAYLEEIADLQVWALALTGRNPVPDVLAGIDYIGPNGKLRTYRF